jgi:hypothetical protein
VLLDGLIFDCLGKSMCSSKLDVGLCEELRLVSCNISQQTRPVGQLVKNSDIVHHGAFSVSFVASMRTS